MRKKPVWLMQKVSLLGLLGITSMILYGDHLHFLWIQHLHRAFHAVGSISIGLYQPAKDWGGRLYEQFWNSPEKVIQLQKKLEALEPLEEHVRLAERQNEELRRLLELPSLQHDLYVTARILNYDQENLTSSCLIDKGEEEGLQKGLAVFSYAGLIGRIDTLGPHHARVTLLHAPDFRVPVVGEKSAVRAVLCGGSKPFLNIVHRDQSKNFEDGERLITIQDHPWLPDGIPVGRFGYDAQGQERIFSVLENFQAHFVRILVLAPELKISIPQSLDAKKKT